MKNSMECVMLAGPVCKLDAGRKAALGGAKHTPPLPRRVPLTSAGRPACRCEQGRSASYVSFRQSLGDSEEIQPPIPLLPCLNSGRLDT